MTIVCNIWMICWELNRFFTIRVEFCIFLNLYEHIRSSMWVVFNNFLLIDATDRSKISSDQKRFFIALSLYPLSFFANTPFKHLFDQGKNVSLFFKFKIDFKMSLKTRKNLDILLLTIFILLLSLKFYM